jgi:phosphoserine phosphatase RsbU/P
MSTEASDQAFLDALVEDDLNALYENAPCGYLSTDPDGRIVKVNATLATWLGHEAADLVGRPFIDLLTGGGRIYHETHYAPLLRMHGQAKEIALEMVRADGKRIPVLVNSVVDQRGDGAPRVIRTAVFDATERRSYERELLDAKRRAEESEARAVSLARTLQQTFIPPAPPVIEGLEVFGAYRPAGDGSEVGGDFYDVFEVGPDEWVATIGDVRGKGVEAALVTNIARHDLRAAAMRDASPAAALAALNEVLLLGSSDRFCTAAFIRLCRRDGRWSLTVAHGGHPLAIVARESGAELVGRPGTLLGAFPEAVAHDDDADLHGGDVLYLYTDGVTEARSPGREFFGDARLLASAARHREAPDPAAALLDEVMEFQDHRAGDDIALLVIRVP